MAEFRIALGAGHRLGTPGKCCLKTLDPNETPEWWLNDRVCDHVEELLKDYDGYELLRVDDTNGEAAVDLTARVRAANQWKADYFLAVHHNAGIKGGKGGGIVVYRYPGNDAETVAWQDEMYEALIKHTGLKGNRANPKPKANLYVLTATRMPATLVELGFMDSRDDVPVILSDDYARKCARAMVEVLVRRGGLKKRQAELPKTVYKVQVGAFTDREKAQKLCDRLLQQGYPAYTLRV